MEVISPPSNFVLWRTRQYNEEKGEVHRAKPCDSQFCEQVLAGVFHTLEFEHVSHAERSHVPQCKAET